MSDDFVIIKGHCSTLVTLCAQLTCDLLAIAEFLVQLAVHH